MAARRVSSFFGLSAAFIAGYATHYLAGVLYVLTTAGDLPTKPSASMDVPSSFVESLLAGRPVELAPGAATKPAGSALAAVKPKLSATGSPPFLTQHAVPPSPPLDREVPATEEHSSTTRTGNGSACGRLCEGPSPECEPFCAPGNSHFFEMYRDCGAVCKTDPADPDVQTIAGPYFDQIRKRVDCDTLMSSQHIDVPQETPHPPESLPAAMKLAYTYNGRVSWGGFYKDQRYYGATKNIASSMHQWTEKMVNEWTRRAKILKLGGTYGGGEANCLQARIREAPLHGLKGKRVLVIGSEIPWVEAICLAHGAATVVTLEYAVIDSQHPNISTMTPEQMRKKYMNGQLESFDVIVSFSSLEHSGLGRYGDSLNPWGDLITVARAWCITKPGGYLVNAVMHAHDFHDKLMWNAHRVYGKVFYPHLFANWAQVAQGCGKQKVYVLQKLEPL